MPGEVDYITFQVYKYGCGLSSFHLSYSSLKTYSQSLSFHFFHISFQSQSQMGMAHFTRSYHRASYFSISPANPVCSQAGRTILITGGTAGIGLAIAQAFMTASASKIVITSREEANLSAALDKLHELRPLDNETELIGCECDAESVESVNKLWETLKRDGIVVDVLILNAGENTRGSLRETSAETWAMFETNVLGNLRMADEFLGQGQESRKVSQAQHLYQSSGLTSRKGPAVYFLQCSSHESSTQ